MYGTCCKLKHPFIYIHQKKYYLPLFLVTDHRRLFVDFLSSVQALCFFPKVFYQVRQPIEDLTEKIKRRKRLIKKYI